MMELEGKKLPVLTSDSLVLFPNAVIPAVVSETENLLALRSAKEEHDGLVIVATRKSTAKAASLKDLYTSATVARIARIKKTDTQAEQVILKGERRVEITSFVVENDLGLATVEPMTGKIDVDKATLAKMVETVHNLAEEIQKMGPPQLANNWEMIRAVEDPEILVNLSGHAIALDVQEAQELMSMRTTKARILRLLEFMQQHRNTLEVQLELGRVVSQEVNQQQREAILRQQMRAIQEELGERAPGGKTNYRQQIEDSSMPKETKEHALEEAAKLESADRNSPETSMLRNYLDLMLALPWGEPQPKDIDLEKAEDILNERHYGLGKVKQRIVEHLAVSKLKGNSKGQILLLVGPPGVGKTSIARSIAKSMGREFVRASLGGVRDEAEIRGHRRTYIGAMPGRIIQALKRAKTNDPVFLLDEIDKLSAGFSGDPSAALLEVLDPEQNTEFHDHYLDVPYDLSNCLFIATANNWEAIPAPLRDRMETIQISGYTIGEKLRIAKDHLWKEVLTENGLKNSQVTLEDEALLHLITHYTREPGVRSLKRELAQVARAQTKKVVEAKDETPVSITAETVVEALGPEKFHLEVANTQGNIGVATGMAWTPVGGEILFIEAKEMPGSGKLTVTGQLGDVMKESVQIAMSHAKSLGSHVLASQDFDKKDIHIHVPSGAVPKDGPSAGVAMLTALVSLLSRKMVDPKLAMTGEITLRGVISPVGGIKEKVLAAHRAGVTHVLLPKRNGKDLIDIPSEVRNELTIHLVETIDDVLEHAFGIKTSAANVVPQQTDKGATHPTCH